MREVLEMKLSGEPLRMRVSAKMKEEVFSANQICTILSNFQAKGNQYAGRVRKALSGKSVSAESLNIKTKGDSAQSYYPLSAVWAYLQKLEDERVIFIPHRVRVPQDIVSYQYHTQEPNVLDIYHKNKIPKTVILL